MLHFSGLHLILVTKSVLSHFCFLAENQRIERLRRVKQNKAGKGKLRTISWILISLNLVHHPAIYLRREGQKQEYANNSLSRGNTRPNGQSGLWNPAGGEQTQKVTELLSHAKKGVRLVLNKKIINTALRVTSAHYGAY